MGSARLKVLELPAPSAGSWPALHLPPARTHRTPARAAPQFILVEPHFNTCIAQAGADPCCRFCVLRSVAEENGSMPVRGGNRVAPRPRFVGHGVLRGGCFEAAECTTASDCANWAPRARWQPVPTKGRARQSRLVGG